MGTILDTPRTHASCSPPPLPSPSPHQTTIELSLGCLGALVITGVLVPWFLLAFPPLMLLFFYLQRRYLLVSRELKRIDGLSRSPIYAHFSQTLQVRRGGVTTGVHYCYA